MAHDVFISHSSKDKVTADAVCAVLESAGIRCWVAPRDIIPGQNWGESIIDAIVGARVMVLIFSGHANQSSQIKLEVERAVNKGVTIIPMRIEDVVPARALEYFISSSHWLDAFSPPLERHAKHLAEIIRKMLGGPTVATLPVPVREPPAHEAPRPVTPVQPAGPITVPIVTDESKVLVKAHGNQRPWLWAVLAIAVVTTGCYFWIYAPGNAREAAGALAEPPPVAVSGEEIGPTLENGFIKVRFTDFGGCPLHVSAKINPGQSHPSREFVFNELHQSPLLVFVNLSGLDSSTRFELVDRTASEVTYRTVVAERLEVIRKYILASETSSSADPYKLRAETSFRNLGAAPYSFPSPLLVAIGTAAPSEGFDHGDGISAGYYNASLSVIPRSRLDPHDGIFGIGARQPIAEVVSQGTMQWVYVADKYFASILTPDEPATGLVTRRIKILKSLPDADANAFGLAADAELNLATIPGQGTATWDATLYVGPRAGKISTN